MDAGAHVQTGQRHSAPATWQAYGFPPTNHSAISV
jgi:hypothetical protein